MGDLASACSAYVSLQQKVDTLSPAMPGWFMAALFFYINSFRFTDCLREFVSGCVGSRELWVPQSDDLLEHGFSVISWVFVLVAVSSYLCTADVNPSIMLKPMTINFMSLHFVTAYCTLLHCFTCYFNLSWISAIP